jgi:hypothetical protein
MSLKKLQEMSNMADSLGYSAVDNFAVAKDQYAKENWSAAMLFASKAWHGANRESLPSLRQEVERWLEQNYGELPKFRDRG